MSAKYLVMDTEATGTDLLNNGLTQIAALALDRNLEIVAEFNEKIRPPQTTRLNLQALCLTGFTLETILQASTPQEVGQYFKSFLDKNFQEKPKVIAQFYPFDYAMLEIFWKQAGLPSGLLDRNFIDTKVLVNWFNLQAKNNGKKPPFAVTSLSKPGGLKDVLDIQTQEGAHDALTDCYMTREVLAAMLDRFQG
jgi:DNA polymerase III epsilon subunit-like protein